MPPAVRDVVQNRTEQKLDHRYTRTRPDQIRPDANVVASIVIIKIQSNLCTVFLVLLSILESIDLYIFNILFDHELFA